MAEEFMSRNETFSRMGEVMNKIMTLHTLCGQDLELSLPRIVVLGSQSVGKSSVLEGIACREFFPRGTGMVTRCPLVLQMHRISSSEDAWVEFVPNDGRKYESDEEIRNEIMRRTNEHTGSNEFHISDTPIVVQLFSPQVLDLTLVDLPGLIRIPKPNQPSNLKDQVKALALKYVSDPNTIILAVSAANFDIAGSESLEVAKRLDPDGHRTVGVITKVDAVSAKGVKELGLILKNFTLPLKLGYFGVINPEVEATLFDCPGTDFAAAREAEQDRLAQLFPDVASKHGTRALQQKLANELAKHIERTAPQVRAQLEKKKGDLVAKLREYGVDESGTQMSDESNHKKIMWQFVQKFGDDLSTVMGFTMNVSTEELSYGPKLNKALSKMVEQIESVPEPSLEEVKVVARNVLGINNPVSNPQQAFHVLVKKVVLNSFKVHVMFGVDDIANLMTECVLNYLMDLYVYPALREAVEDLMLKKISENSKLCKEYLEMFLNVESCYPNFNHPDFQRRKLKMEEEELKRALQEKSAELVGNNVENALLGQIRDKLAETTKKLEKELARINWDEQFDTDVEKFRNEVIKYLEVQEMTIVDQAPKAVVKFVVNDTIHYAIKFLLQEEPFCNVDSLMQISNDRLADIDVCQRQLKGIVDGLKEFAKMKQ